MLSLNSNIVLVTYVWKCEQINPYCPFKLMLAMFHRGSMTVNHFTVIGHRWTEAFLCQHLCHKCTQIFPVSVSRTVCIENIRISFQTMSTRWHYFSPVSFHCHLVFRPLIIARYAEMAMVIPECFICICIAPRIYAKHSLQHTVHCWWNRLGSKYELSAKKYCWLSTIKILQGESVITRQSLTETLYLIKSNRWLHQLRKSSRYFA